MFFANVSTGEKTFWGRSSRPATPCGAVAQLGERLLCKQEVTSSILVGSTSSGAPRRVGA